MFANNILLYFGILSVLAISKCSHGGIIKEFLGGGKAGGSLIPNLNFGIGISFGVNNKQQEQIRQPIKKDNYGPEYHEHLHDSPNSNYHHGPPHEHHHRGPTHEHHHHGPPQEHHHHGPPQEHHHHGPPQEHHHHGPPEEHHQHGPPHDTDKFGPDCHGGCHGGLLPKPHPPQPHEQPNREEYEQNRPNVDPIQPNRPNFGQSDDVYNNGIQKLPNFNDNPKPFPNQDNIIHITPKQSIGTTARPIRSTSPKLDYDLDVRIGNENGPIVLDPSKFNPSTPKPRENEKIIFLEEKRRKKRETVNYFNGPKNLSLNMFR